MSAHITDAFNLARTEPDINQLEWDFDSGQGASKSLNLGRMRTLSCTLSVLKSQESSRCSGKTLLCITLLEPSEPKTHFYLFGRPSGVEGLVTIWIQPDDG